LGYNSFETKVENIPNNIGFIASLIPAGLFIQPNCNPQAKSRNRNCRKIDGKVLTEAQLK